MKSSQPPSVPWYLPILTHRQPQAFVRLRGSSAYPSVDGRMRFYDTPHGVLVSTELTGLPSCQTLCCERIFAFHIHEGHACTGNQQDPFADAQTHYNPRGCQHPYHAGDLPPLFGANGRALSICLTDHFNIQEVLGRTVIVHERLDDFTTQPSGNAGTKIACGVIQPVSQPRRR